MLTQEYIDTVCDKSKAQLRQDVFVLAELGFKRDGYFIEFTEDIKPMMVNSINRKTINAVVKESKKCTSAESRFRT
jgi:hypothetical protein